MGKFTKDAEDLLKYVGGKENINAVSHCVTRMRFVLVDPSKADIDAIEAIPSAKGTFTQSGQFQVIIGNEVSEFYNDFVAVSGIEGVSKAAVKNAAKSNQTILQKIMGDLGEIFAPIIPALICGGLILGFRNVIGDIALVNGKTLTQTSQFWMGTYNFLWLIGEAVFHMLPVGICWSVTKKMGTTQILGIILGLTLVSGQLLNGFSVATTAANKIPVWNFGFAKVKMIGYQGQVIAAIMAAFVLVYLEKFWRKVCPAVISMIVVPFMSLVPAVILAHTVVGPIGWTIGDGIATVVKAGLSGSFRVVFAAIFGALYAPIVMTGLHHMTNAIDMTLIQKYKGTILWPMIALSNIAQGSAVLGMSVLQRKNDRAQQVNIPALISCYLGVTEPAGIPGILSIKPQFWGTFALAMLVAIVIPFVLTLIVGKKKLSAEDLLGKQAAKEAAGTALDIEKVAPENEEFIAPMTGHCYKIEDIDDQAFASKAMGDGIAIELTDGKVYAPFSGEIVMTFPTKHAYGLKTANGKEILIHIGMDTVELDGVGFTSHVEMGDHVSQGDLLVDVDLDKIKSAGKSLVSPVVFTDKSNMEILKYNTDVKAGEKDILKLED